VAEGVGPEFKLQKYKKKKKRERLFVLSKPRIQFNTQLPVYLCITARRFFYSFLICTNCQVGQLQAYESVHCLKSLKQPLLALKGHMFCRIQ
jgi:hypothetical protein